MWITDRRVRDLIGGWLESIANEVCETHARGISQEHQISARVGEAIEQSWSKELADAGVLGHRVTVITQDIPDRGPGSMESRLGADLYVGVEIRTEEGRVSKGFLVQAKWAGPLKKSEREDLVRQCNDMLKRSPAASYVWSYSEYGIKSQQVKVSSSGPMQSKTSMNIGPLISEVLACNEGDPRLGLPDVEDERERRVALGNMLRDLAVPHGVAMTVRVPHGSARGARSA